MLLYLKLQSKIHPSRFNGGSSFGKRSGWKLLEEIDYCSFSAVTCAVFSFVCGFCRQSVQFLRLYVPFTGMLRANLANFRPFLCRIFVCMQVSLLHFTYKRNFCSPDSADFPTNVIFAQDCRQLPPTPQPLCLHPPLAMYPIVCTLLSAAVLHRRNRAGIYFAKKLPEFHCQISALPFFAAFSPDLALFASRSA